MIAVGDTLWMKNPASPNKKHLFFVIALTPDGTEAILANMSTRDHRSVDLSCVLQPGEHPRVIDESVIKYLEMIKSRVADLDKYLRYFPQDADTPAAAAIIDRIQQGASASDFARPEYVQIVQDWIAANP